MLLGVQQIRSHGSCQSDRRYPSGPPPPPPWYPPPPPLLPPYELGARPPPCWKFAKSSGCCPEPCIDATCLSVGDCTSTGQRICVTYAAQARLCSATLAWALHLALGRRLQRRLLRRSSTHKMSPPRWCCNLVKHAGRKPLKDERSSHTQTWCCFLAREGRTANASMRSSRLSLPAAICFSSPALTSGSASRAACSSRSMTAASAASFCWRCSELRRNCSHARACRHSVHVS